MPRKDELRKYTIKAWVKTDDHQEAEIEVVQLGIAESLLADATVAIMEEAERAYGGCRSCYGKGWASVIDSTIAYADFGDELGGARSRKTEKLQMKLCTCERGKQLQRRFREAERAAKENEKACLELIDERDSLERRLDSLSEAVAAYFNKDIGEHSSMNDPWYNAFEMLRDNTTTKESKKTDSVHVGQGDVNTSDVQDISLCKSCYCMTHAVDGRCGKCGAAKDVQDNEAELEGKLLVLFRRMSVCAATHQGDYAEWIDGQCVTPTTAAKEAMKLIVAHDQTLKEKLLEGTRSWSITDLELLQHQTGDDEVEAVPVEHINSVFDQSGKEQS